MLKILEIFISKNSKCPISSTNNSFLLNFFFEITQNHLESPFLATRTSRNEMSWPLDQMYNKWKKFPADLRIPGTIFRMQSMYWNGLVELRISRPPSPANERTPRNNTIWRVWVFPRGEGLQKNLHKKRLKRREIMILF